VDIVHRAVVAAIPLPKDYRNGFPLSAYANGSACFSSEIILSFKSLTLPGPRTDAPEPNLVDVLDSEALDNAFIFVLISKSDKIVEKEAVGPFNWALFERFLPSQKIHATPEDVAGVYATVFFRHSGVFGSGTSLASPYRITRAYLAPPDTHTQAASRYVEGETIIQRHYALIWSKEISEDTVEGWEKAESEALERGTRVYLSDIYRCWCCGMDDKYYSPLRSLFSIPNADLIFRKTWRDFAIIIFIGTKFKIFHVRSPKPTIPTANSFQHIQSELSKLSSDKSFQFSCRYGDEKDMKLWKDVGINLDSSELWEVVDEIAARGEKYPESSARYQDGRFPPLDVLEEKDRPYIDGAMRWLGRLSKSYDKKTRNEVSHW
jgi:hypothetical protein